MRVGDVCKRGHLVSGDNAKTRLSTKYVACRQCERDSQKQRLKRSKSLKDEK
jgi:hypothetical protein